MKQSVMSAVKDTFGAGNHGYQQQTNYAEKRKKALKPVIILCIICILVWWYIAATATAYAYNNVISIMDAFGHVLDAVTSDPLYAFRTPGVLSGMGRIFSYGIIVIGIFGLWLYAMSIP